MKTVTLDITDELLDEAYFKSKETHLSHACVIALALEKAGVNQPRVGLARYWAGDDGIFEEGGPGYPLSWEAMKMRREFDDWFMHAAKRPEPTSFEVMIP